MALDVHHPAEIMTMERVHKGANISLTRMTFPIMCCWSAHKNSSWEERMTAAVKQEVRSYEARGLL